MPTITATGASAAHRRGVRGRHAVALLAVVAGFGCAPPPVEPAPGSNVLLVVMDTTRRDHLSCYGWPKRTTPRLDELARDGLLFTRAVAVSNWTLPTHVSLFTGLYPRTHGAHALGLIGSTLSHAAVLAEERTTLAEILKSSGYRTAGIVGNFGWLRPTLGVAQGFDHYDARCCSRPASTIVDLAVEWMQQDDEQPFFVFVNFMDPHAPYAPPEEEYAWKFVPTSIAEEARALVDEHRILRDLGEGIVVDSATELAVFEARYDGEIAYMDAQIGRLLDWLRAAGRYDDTLVIVTADHGEHIELGQLMGHGRTLSEGEVAVPMIVKLPAGRPRGVRDYRVSQVDVVPTVLEVLGMAVPPDVQGRSMLQESRRDLVVESRWRTRGGARRALYRDDIKYVEDPDGNVEIFDLETDPAEAHGVRGEAADQLGRRMHAALDSWADEVAPVDAVVKKLDEEAIRRLRQLGYVEE